MSFEGNAPNLIFGKMYQRLSSPKEGSFTTFGKIAKVSRTSLVIKHGECISVVLCQTAGFGENEWVRVHGEEYGGSIKARVVQHLEGVDPSLFERFVDRCTSFHRAARKKHGLDKQD